MPHCDLLLTDAAIATMTPGTAHYGIVRHAALAIDDGRIVYVGAMADLPAFVARRTHSVAGRWLTPALIDCHTHLVFAGNRAAEFAERLKGRSYEDIARAGGGILSTVEATRAADEATLVRQAAVRLSSLKSEGCATVEIKSGYGLDLETELRMLEVARRLAGQCGVSVFNTFLGAHAVPAEFAGRPGAYLDYVCEEMLPAVHARKLADAVDAYCEPIAFSVTELRRVFETAAALGLPVKLHADQLSDSGGAALAAEFGALSADHLEYANREGISAMAKAGTVAVLLPGAFVTLGETRLPPVQQLREGNVPMAVATDCNPGTSPLCSLRTAMGLAARVFAMTPEECLAGVTRNAAVALGLDDRGTLEAGKRADIAVWDIGHPQELAYWIGCNGLADLYIAGNRQ